MPLHGILFTKRYFFFFFLPLEA